MKTKESEKITKYLLKLKNGMSKIRMRKRGECEAIHTANALPFDENRHRSILRYIYKTLLQ
jgi:hypothetical protein